MSADLYEAPVDALLDQCRLDALRVVDSGHRDHVEQVYLRVERSAVAGLRHGFAAPDWADRRTLLAGIVAAHIVQSRLRDRAADLAGVVADTLPVLWDPDLHARLAAVRPLMALTREDADLAASERAVVADMRGVLDDLAVLLRRARGSELVAASGHLARAVVDAMTTYRQHTGVGWYGALGDRLLVPREVLAAAAVGLVDAGRPKIAVAGLAGISRSTLDAWLSA